MSFRVRKKRTSFTLSELFIVMIIIALVGFMFFGTDWISMIEQGKDSFFGDQPVGAEK